MKLRRTTEAQKKKRRVKEKSKKEENQTWATNGSSILQEAGPQGESLKMLRRMCKRQKVVCEQVICILERRKRGKEPLDVLSKSSSKEAERSEKDK